MAATYVALIGTLKTCAAPPLIGVPPSVAPEGTTATTVLSLPNSTKQIESPAMVDSITCRVLEGSATRPDAFVTASACVAAAKGVNGSAGRYDMEFSYGAAGVGAALAAATLASC